MKKCGKCKVIKKLEEYYKSPKRYDGVRSYCKPCTKIINAEAKVYRREYLARKWKEDEDFKKRALGVMKNYEKKHGRNKIYWKFHNKVKKGEIIKQPCIICGETNRIHGHHKDYSKPYDVVWLCPLHHKRVHVGDIAI